MTKEPVVFLPDIACDARLFAPQIDSLSGERAVMVAPTHLGERIEQIASEVLTVAPPKFALVGAGLGGVVALELYRKSPDRIIRLALLGTNAMSDTPEQASAREPQIVKARSGKLRVMLRDEILPQQLTDGPYREHIQNLCMDMAETLGPEAFVAQTRAMQRRRDHQPTLRKMKCPTLVVSGEHDQIATVQRAKFMAELVPHGHLQVIGGAAHRPSLEQPDLTTQVLREWLGLPWVLQ